MSPSSASRATTDEAVMVVYGADWCPDVKRTRALLDAVDQPYTYLNIDTDAAARPVVHTLQRGRRRIPTLVCPDGR
jgi:glutaredoxin